MRNQGSAARWSGYALILLAQVGVMCGCGGSPDTESETPDGAGASDGAGATDGAGASNASSGGAAASGGVGATTGTGAAPSGSGGGGMTDTGNLEGGPGPHLCPDGMIPVDDGVTYDNADPSLVISSLESGAGFVSPGGQSGRWYSSNDGTGMQLPPTDSNFPTDVNCPARGLSYRSAHTVGSGFSGWGAAVGLNLNNPAGTPMPYDVSSYSGISFWAKGSSPGLRVEITDEGSGAGSVPPGAAITLTSTWQKFTFTWAELLDGGGSPLDPSVPIVAIRFSIEPGAFDFYIDDVAFTQ